MAVDRNVNVRVTSSFDGSGLTAAERAAWKLEQRERRMVAMQQQASREMVAAEARKAEAIEAANARQRAAMEGVGRAITVGSLAVAAGLAISAKAAMDWESAFAGVRKTVDGTDEEIAALEGELRGLARSLPATHQEIAAVAEAAGQLGVARGDVTAFTRTMIALGETTNLTADEAATSLAQFSNIMGESQSQAGRLGAALVALGNAGASTESQIMDMGLRLAGAGRTAGLTSGQVLGMASAMSSVGIQAEAGGTAMSRVMLQITSDVQDGSDRVEQYARVAGMSAAEFATAWRQDAGSALASFVEGLGRMQAEGGNTTAVLDQLGLSEVRVADSLRRASLAGDEFRASLQRGEGAIEANVALAEEFNKRLETTEARVAIAKNTINDAAIDIGGTLLPALASGADGVANLAAGFQALPDPAKQFATTLGLITSGLGLVVGGASVAIPKMQELAATITALHGGSSRLGTALGGAVQFLTGPWGLALAGAGIAVGVLTAIIGANARAQEEMRQEAQSLAETLDEVTGAVTEQTRQQVVNNLVTAEAFDLGEKYGQSASDVARAVFGSAEAFSEWKDQVLAANEGTGSHLVDLNTLIGVIEDERDALAESKVVWEASGEAMGAAADAADTTTASFEDQKQAIDELIEATDAMNKASRSAAEAEIDWVEQLGKTAGVLAENSRTLDINTEAGRANQRTLLDMAREGQALAEARLRQSGSEETYRSTLAGVRQGLLETARRFFDTEEEAQAYVDTLLRVPPEVTTDVNADTAQAEADINRTARDRVSTVRVRVDLPQYSAADIPGSAAWLAARGISSADGNVIQYFAGGGFRENHVAQFAPGGVTRVWGEPETGGEAYIPLAPSKRARSMDVWEQTGQLLGAFDRLQAPTAGVKVDVGQIVTTDPEAAVRVLTSRMRDATRLAGGFVA